MDRTLTVYGFQTSNNMKVRVALGYKGIPYTFVTIDPADRSEIVEISGQHLTPVMVHGDVVLFDSAAILRYLDAAFRETPRLFGRSRVEQWAIEDHELFARAILAGPMMAVVHHRSAGGTVDDAMRTRAERDFDSACGRLIDALEGREWLVGDSMTAADITAAAVLRRIQRSGLFELPARAAAILPWVDRVMAHDAHA